MLRVPFPQTAVEWADEHFYLSGESSSIAGRWTTLPFQVAILNAMGNSDVQRCDVFKSARVGFTKLMLAALGYFLAKKRRSVAFWQPTDSDRDEFVKTEVDPAIRDVPAWCEAFPDWNKKSKLNTLEIKGHVGATAWFKGGTSAKNFRRISPDVAMLDEIDAFDADIDGEGDALSLAWKRCEVSSFRKLIVGSSPKEKGTSQIEASAETADAFLRFHLPCPHCGHQQPLRWGGFKWEKGKPETVEYECSECKGRFGNDLLSELSERGVWRDVGRGIETRDGLEWFSSGERVEAPLHVAFHVWSAYSPFTTWREIVKDWLNAQGNPLRLKTFVNTTLGETWEDVHGESLSKEKLHARCEEYLAPLPSERIVAVTAGVDVQGDRFEVTFDGWGPGMECWTLGHVIVPAETDKLDDWKDRLAPVLERTFESEDGLELTAEAVGIDTGYQTQTAYRFCQLHIAKNWLAFKGQPGDRPVMHPKPMGWKSKRGLDVFNVGVDAGKDVVFSMLARESGPQSTHFPDDGLPADYFEQLTAERRRFTLNKKTGQKRFHWHCPEGRRNEAFDCKVYSYAALEWLRIQRRLDLDERYASRNEDSGVSWSDLF